MTLGCLTFHVNRTFVDGRYEPPMDSPADLVPCYGIKVMNQNLGIPNDLLGRCVFMLPMRRLVEGKEQIDLRLELEHGPGTIDISVKMTSADIEKAQRELKASLVAITGGLSTRFSSKRLHEKLEVEDIHEASIKRVVSLVASKELDLEELYQKHGSGGGKGARLYVWAMCGVCVCGDVRCVDAR